MEANAAKTAYANFARRNPRPQKSPATVRAKVGRVMNAAVIASKRSDIRYHSADGTSPFGLNISSSESLPAK